MIRIKIQIFMRVSPFYAFLCQTYPFLDIFVEALNDKGLIKAHAPDVGLDEVFPLIKLLVR
jgi:hypothetical protein